MRYRADRWIEREEGYTALGRSKRLPVGLQSGALYFFTPFLGLIVLFEARVSLDVEENAAAAAACLDGQWVAVVANRSRSIRGFVGLVARGGSSGGGGEGIAAEKHERSFIR